MTNANQRRRIARDARRDAKRDVKRATRTRAHVIDHLADYTASLYSPDSPPVMVPDGNSEGTYLVTSEAYMPLSIPANSPQQIAACFSPALRDNVLIAAFDVTNNRSVWTSGSDRDWD